ncbi:MAG: hypothetical protein WC551_10285 [Patescibacteria group bacterium]
MKRLLFVLLAIPTLCFAADGINYRDAFVGTHLIPDEQTAYTLENGTAIVEGVEVPVYETRYGALRLDLPCPVYSQSIIHEGKDITYSLSDMSLNGAEVVARIHYSTKNWHGQTDDCERVLESPYFLTDSEAEIINNEVYKRHWFTKKAEALGTWDGEIFVPCAGTDKDELTVWAN